MIETFSYLKSKIPSSSQSKRARGERAFCPLLPPLTAEAHRFPPARRAGERGAPPPSFLFPSQRIPVQRRPAFNLIVLKTNPLFFSPFSRLIPLRLCGKKKARRILSTGIVSSFFSPFAAGVRAVCNGVRPDVVLETFASTPLFLSSPPLRHGRTIPQHSRMFSEIHL